MAVEKRVPEHGNLGESEQPTTVGYGRIGESPETEFAVGGGTRTIRVDEKYSEIVAGEPGLLTTSAPGGVSASESEEEGEMSEEEEFTP